MELSQLNTGLDSCIGGGAMAISVEYKAALQASLVLLKNRENFQHVKLWGKIAGISRDYFIAQGFGQNQVTDRKSFYSTDHCVTWLELPKVHPVTAASARRLTVRFTGNATYEYTVTEPGPSPSDAPLDLPPDVEKTRQKTQNDDGSEITTTIKEDQRLATVIQAIDADCAVVPYGSYIRTSAGEMVPKSSFVGLSRADAGKLQSYMHFRIPIRKRTKSEKAQQDLSLDFFDRISEDVPAGSWSLQHERGGDVIVLKSLVWPGFSFFHAPGTTNYGYVYNGIAQKNADLAFMLPSLPANK